ncbi:MAG: S41 family peptidase [Planctomycetes bacterium]|nr:S41 family peptidase [Planctomycetota bacterium]
MAIRAYLRALSLSAALAASLFSAAWTSAQQVHIPASALETPVAVASEVQEVLARGQVLESERKWGEALSVYEDALREHPELAALQQRVTIARMHLDVARRYSDADFVTSVTRMTEQQALDLYAEVLQKIETNYVHQPDWRELVDRGATQVEASVTEPAFGDVRLANLSPEQREAFLRDFRPALAQYRALNRTEARNLTAWGARFAAQRLGVPPQVFVMEFICGAGNGLDRYSTFLTSTQLDDIFSQIEGNFVGLGIELKTEEDSLDVVNVIAGSPAEKGGLRTGDRILGVDGQTVAALTSEKAADMLKGPEGSTVQLDVAEESGQTRRLLLTRQRVELPSIEGARIIDPEYGVAYLRLPAFQKTTSRDLNEALWKLYREGMKSLIIDVRGNPGGLLDSSVEVADKFITEGKIVSTRGRNSREDSDRFANRYNTWRVPLVVLIDQDSASASEIFAGAIRDSRRGVVVGERSYGKGSVQGIFPLNTSKAGLRLTTAKFYSPSGQAIANAGVAPDVTVQITAKPVAETGENVAADEDAILNAGLEVARQRLSQR